MLKLCQTKMTLPLQFMFSEVVTIRFGKRSYSSYTAVKIFIASFTF